MPIGTSEQAPRSNYLFLRLERHLAKSGALLAAGGRRRGTPGMISRHKSTIAAFRGRCLALFRSTDAKGATQLGLASLLLPLGGLFANIVFARTLGAGGRGDIAALVVILAVCEIVIVFGIPDILARHIARNTLPNDVVRALALGTVCVAILPGFMVTVYFCAKGFPTYVAVAAGLVVPVAAVIGLGRGVLNGRQNYRQLSFALIVSGIARFIAPSALLLSSAPAQGLAMVLVTVAIAAPVVPILCSKPFKGSGFAFRSSVPILKESLRVWPAVLAWHLISKVDQLLLAVFASPADLGRYAVCAGIAEMPAILAGGARNVILARVAKTSSFDKIPAGTAAIVACGGALAVVSWLFADPIMDGLFGPEFRSTSLVLALLFLAVAFDIAAGVSTSCLIAVGRGGSVAGCYISGLVLAVLILPMGLSLGGGVVCAAIARLAASALPYILATAMLRRTTPDTGGRGQP